MPTDQLLASAAFDTLIQTAVERFEIVVIDTPPVLVVGDGTYVSRHADTIAFVVKWAETSQAEARAGLNRLEAFKRPDADFLVVLNQHESMRSSVFDRYMRNYQRR
ncbi:hypothetical protein [Pelagibacterium lacus]|uniref:Uncharacterized protein n=1 Tax=Pelagibacterium lacus TaxID=2282655 RepID=A0A369W7D9_9HYPH|nr:hypothetical protein [Pelagibacterium lacus]RDE09152.1 hypothetical protein DVH29_08150 [Pelagibacterium lacus]